MDNINYFSLNGHDTTEWGIGLSGTGVWDAPARKGESISVPGRNGNIWVDDGSYENILVTYPCWMPEEFDTNIDDFRAFLALHSHDYFELRDTYHPNEFRLARYAGPFVSTPGTRNISGRFDVVFDCYPQRFLDSGASWVNIAVPNVDPSQNIANLLTETNPTGFDAAPVLMVAVSALLPTPSYTYVDLSLRNDSQGRYNYIQLTGVTTGKYYYIDCENFSAREGTTSEAANWETFPLSSAVLTITPQTGTVVDYTAMLYDGENKINNRTLPTGSQTYTNLARFSILKRYWTI